MADAAEKFRQEQYRVLVGLAHPERLEGLMSIASVFARRQQGRIVVVSVVPSPASTTPAPETLASAQELVERARDFGAELGIAVEPVVQVAEDVPSGIVTVARNSGPGMVLLGYSPPTTPTPDSAETPARITEEVAKVAGCSLAIVAFSDEPGHPPRLLMPIKEDFDADITGDLARIAALFGGAWITFLGLLPSGLAEPDHATRARILQDRVEGLDIGEMTAMGMDCATASDCLFGAEAQQMGGEALSPAFMLRVRV